MSISFMQIPCLPELDTDRLQEAGILLDKTDFRRIACNNWPDRFPNTVQVAFCMAHNGKVLFVKFRVEESCTMARICKDNGEVWTDSCVELFLALDDSGYYNFEFTCIGKTLLGFRKERPAAVYAPTEILASILRYPSLGEENFEETQLGHPWELTVAIPARALFKHNIATWQGVKARINLHKCGDKLSRPHYLTWQPIDTPKPDFHVPRCFVPVQFQKMTP